jgi:hypothetical protein
MRESKNTVATAYGPLDKAALLEAQNRYDTRGLLQAVDELDELVAAVTAEDGVRDMLLRLHGTAHTMIDGAELSVATNRETLPELAGRCDRRTTPQHLGAQSHDQNDRTTGAIAGGRLNAASRESARRRMSRPSISLSLPRNYMLCVIFRFILAGAPNLLAPSGDRCIAIGTTQ